MKVKNLLFSALLFSSLFFSITISAQNLSKQNPNNIQGPPQRTCGTEIPSQQWEDLLQQKVAEFLAANPEISAEAKQGVNNTQAVYTIPVIIHVIHGGQAVGTFPNLAQGQLNSQITVLNNDFAGVGQNIGNYPGTAFTTYATHTLISSASKDALARIKIANTGVTFCLALQDTLGNILTEPGIHRVNYNTLPALTGTFTSKNPANAAYNTPGRLQGFINGYIKPNTIWNVRKYMNIWVTDQNASVGLLGYATFPPLSGLIGIPGGVGTATSDGFWSWSAAFGSSTIFPGGTYAAPYDKGRTCTHEIGHWVGLRHIWGDGTCATDYCNDTPPAAGPNFGAPAYPVTPGSCAGPPSNSPNGEMAMNFMDYTDDLAMYMFTEDQRTRLQTAMLNSPYRNQLGTHGLCSVPPPTANFTIVPNPICAGQTATITDLSTGSPGAWSYTMTGGSPATSTLQSPTVTYTAAGVYSITLIASNGGGNSAPVIRTITVNAIPVLTVTPSPSTVCAGGSSTITASGATTYSWSTSATTSSIVVTPTANTIYTVTGANGTCINTRTVLVAFSVNPTVNITPASATICSGNSTTLTGSGATNYTWMPSGNTTASISASPSITTTYTLTGTNAAGCSGTRTVQVTVNTTPTVNVVANPTLVCGGSSSTLTASGATTYSWNTSATTSSIVVTPTINTTYTVTGTSSGCSNTRTVSVTVSGSPTVNITPTSATICSGSSTTLSGSGATNYTWMPGGNTTTSISVSPTITTTYTLTGANIAGCTATRTVQVTVNTTPTVAIVASSTLICAGSNLTLTASGASTYSWSSGHTTSSVVTIPGGSITYTVTGTNGSCSDTETISIVVNTMPIITIVPNTSTICAGVTSTLSGSGVSTYTWIPSGINTATISVTPSITTVYTLTGSNGGPCVATRTAQIVVINNPTLSVLASPSVICAGATASLTASGATTYSWSTGATTSVVAASPTITSTYTVTGFNGSCNNTRTVSILVNALPSLTITPTTAVICAGSSVTFTGSGATSYSWMPGSVTTSTIIVTPTITTIYTLTGTNAAGCVRTRTTSVNVNALPTLTITSNPTSICPGSTATLTASGSGGPGPFTYTWSTGATSALTTSSVAGVYTATVANGSGCRGTQSFSLNAAAGLTITANATPTSICLGGSTTITANGASTYTWNTGPTSSSIAVSPSITTTYTVNGTSGSCTGSRTISIVVNANPTVNVVANPTLVCSGNSSTLTASGAVTYSWSTGSTSLTSVVNPTLTSTYTVTGTNASGCSNTRTISVTVNAAPSITALSSSSLICVGQSAVLTASSSAITYTWSTGSNSSSVSISPTVTTNYTVSGTNAAGCVGSTIISQSVSPCTEITSLANTNANYSAYPNPNSGEFSVTVEKITENTFIEIYNTIGQLVSKQLVKDYTTTINLTEQADGIYYVIVTKNSKHLYKTKVIKD
ncbi:MAG: T9SS type A sorting domain-containing protein [Bacteroidia bacterium]|nr:T9SS type A sorting domain-containing protein [Bacteroidia bacterium]